MAEVLVIEFTAPDAAKKYKQVDDQLGSDWPAGVISHIAGDDGDKLIVVEIWESQAAQAEFMETRLGPALAQAGAPAPDRMQWFANTGSYHR